MTHINLYQNIPQQGWECPKCHRIYSPSTCMCFYCGTDISKNKEITCIADNNSAGKTLLKE